MQVLWLGKPDIAVTWEPESSLPTAVIARYPNWGSATCGRL